MIGKVFHIWQCDDGWEVRGTEDLYALEVFDSKDEAIEWCKEHAEEADVCRICFWNPMMITAGRDTD